jgi:predicted alpha/beta-hydrolase family hydrolase
VLERCYRAVIDAVRERVDSARRALFIGGKSMGGRIATQVAAADAALPLAGLVLLGYPLHPPGQPDRLRDAHLPAVARPMLFVQGTRDAFGTPEELAPILSRVSPAPVLHEVAGGDHSFKLGGRDAAVRQAALYDEIQRVLVEWMALTAARAGER